MGEFRQTEWRLLARVNLDVCNCPWWECRIIVEEYRVWIWPVCMIASIKELISYAMCLLFLPLVWGVQPHAATLSAGGASPGQRGVSSSGQGDPAEASLLPAMLGCGGAKQGGREYQPQPGQVMGQSKPSGSSRGTGSDCRQAQIVPQPGPTRAPSAGCWLANRMPSEVGTKHRHPAIRWVEVGKFRSVLCKAGRPVHPSPPLSFPRFPG